MDPGQVVVVDVDGTLVDTNYHHVVAWDLAFDRIGAFVPTNVLHRHVGMGGRPVRPAVAGEELERGGATRSERCTTRSTASASSTTCGPIPTRVASSDGWGSSGCAWCSPRRRGRTRSTATSTCSTRATSVDAWTSSADVERTKPHPDLLEAAIAKVGAAPAFLVGDSVWDLRGREADRPPDARAAHRRVRPRRAARRGRRRGLRRPPRRARADRGARGRALLIRRRVPGAEVAQR